MLELELYRPNIFSTPKLTPVQKIYLDAMSFELGIAPFLIFEQGVMNNINSRRKFRKLWRKLVKKYYANQKEIFGWGEKHATSEQRLRRKILVRNWLIGRIKDQIEL